MTRELKQSTATTVIVGPFLDDTDGKTAETGLTVASIDVDIYKGITKTDLTITASGGNNDMAHVANGYYSLELTATDTNTLGLFRITFNISGALPFYEDFVIRPAEPYDTLIGGTDNLTVELSTATIDLIHDEVIEGSVTHRQGQRLLLSALTGESFGGGTSNVGFRDIGDTKNRLAFTLDGSGNRTAVGTRDGT